jgi:hypothetical protein
MALGLLVSQRAPERLRRDLGAGWLLLQVPRPFWQLLLGSLALPAGGRLVAVALGTIGGGVLVGASPASTLVLLALLPAGVLAATLGGAVDLIRTNQNNLAAGQLHPPGMVGLILGLIGVGAPLGLWWGVGGGAGLALGLAAGGLLCLGLLYGAGAFYRQTW